MTELEIGTEIEMSHKNNNPEYTSSQGKAWWREHVSWLELAWMILDLDH